LCGQLDTTFLRDVARQNGGPLLEVTCRCVDAPFPEPSRRSDGRQWWRYDQDGRGDRPEDWAEMEIAATRIAEELDAPAEPYDGVLGFSQGAEMVHTIAVLAHRGDPRFSGPRAPKFGVSLSGAVNPGHFEAQGAGGPPEGCVGPRAGPGSSALGWPLLFVGDFDTDGWYSTTRFEETLGLYADATRVEHAQQHAVPALGDEAVAAARRFFSRFAAGTS